MITANKIMGQVQLFSQLHANYASMSLGLIYFDPELRQALTNYGMTTVNSL